MKLKVSKESASGLNTEFVNVETGRHIPLEQAVTQISNNDALDEYHRKLPGFYMEQGKSMTDEDLDFVIYGYVVAKSA